MKRFTRLIIVLLVLIVGTLSLEQVSYAEEPDTAAFITTTFQLQETYSRVLCVSGDNTCLPEITVAVPCLTTTCTTSEQTYPIAATFETIQQASDAAQPGDLIVITPGRYAGVQAEDTGGADGAYIHFLGLGELGDVVVDRSSDPSKSFLRHHFYFINVHHYMIQNIVFTNANEGAGVFVSGYFSATGAFSHHIIVTDIYAHDNYSWGMHSTSTSQVLIQDSVFANSVDEHGLYISGSGDDVVIRRNIFQGNHASGVQVNPDPQTATAEIFYWLQNSTGDTCGWTEDDVDFTGAAQWHDMKACYDSQGLPDLGLYIEDGISENLIIENNIMTDNGAAGAAGINLASVRHSVIRNNLIYGNHAAGIACWDNAYAEEKGLDVSDFGCHNVIIANNTLVDETGGRGALILNQDARDMQIFNNIIVRDRYDAYEITENSGTGLQSGNNYYFAQSVTDSPGFDADVDSFTGFTIAEALAHFVQPGFEPWLSLNSDSYTLNPNRPDYHVLADSVLATGGNPAYISTADLLGDARGNEIGAFNVGSGAPSVSVETTSNPETTPPLTTTGAFEMVGTLVYYIDGQAHMIRDGEFINISTALDAVSTGEDGFVNLSPDGEWLILETTRFDLECNGWSCWSIVDAATFSNPEVIYIDGQALHAEGAAAISSGGDLIIFEGFDGPNDVDLYAVHRMPDGTWGDVTLLTGASTYPFNRQPNLSADGTRMLFDCRTEPYVGGAICEVGTNGEHYRVIATPENPPQGYGVATFLHHADYAPDGSIIFEADWAGEQIWAIAPDNTFRLINSAYGNDNTPCVLPNGNIVSLWLGRPEGEGIHEIKMMSLDGSQELMLVIDEDVADIGLGCGQ